MIAKKKKILVVDDEADILELFKSRIKASGYDVATASNGKEALEKLISEKPDAVLLDVMMPGISGLDVLKKIREYDQNLPVFIITAFSNEERFLAASKLNASGFIMKTSDLKEEIVKIGEALKIAEKYKKE